MTARIVIAGTGSGTGKTTVACGLMGALHDAGLRVQGFKVGPDYIDPSYHRLACGRPGRNLDAFLSGAELIGPLFRHGAAGADIAVVEGVMGLFDGASETGELASTAHVAKLLDAPVILVVDGSAMSRSAAAMVHGFRTFDPALRLGGVIFNRAGSEIHERLLRSAVAELGVPVLGALRRDASIASPERHLGLVPAAEREGQAAAALGSVTAAVQRGVDLEAVRDLAARAPSLSCHPWGAEFESAEPAASRVGVAIAKGPAFSFHYEENLELLRAAGAQLLPFDPLRDDALPDGARALILAGGFPEIFARELGENLRLRGQIAAFAASGAPVLAECGGLLYLAEDLDGVPMCGVLPVHARMGDRLTLGYREAEAITSTPWLAPGTRLRGHEFHYSQASGEERTAAAAPAAAWQLSSPYTTRKEGFVRGSVQASYLHTHWAAFPQLARGFVAAAAAAPPVGPGALAA